MNTSTAHAKILQKDISLEKLKTLKWNELYELFKTLKAPSFSEMQGEYNAALLDCQGPFDNVLGSFALRNGIYPGKWLCKAFTAQDKKTGHGYNSFSRFGKVVRIFPMKTSIVKSFFDGKDVFELYYPEYKSLLGFSNMVDEIRKIKDNLYLGIGRWGFTEKQRSKVWPFSISGPAAPFIGTDKVYKKTQ